MNKDLANREEDQENIDLFLLIERSILFFRKYRWIFITAILLGLSAGYFFYRIIPTTYKSRMVVHSFMLTNQEEIQIVKTKEKELIVQLLRSPFKQFVFHDKSFLQPEIPTSNI